ncbi:MAG TPA: GPW/gp25 family protein [Kofleriaceae bacterium]|nr:GPW/gp25 family protein [Kofleriaceae bacterium]
MVNRRDFLGRGWRFPVAINRTGGIATSAQEENIRESIFIILGTAPGERIKRLDFGCDIHELVFAPNNPATAALAVHYCDEALRKWEPRIHKIVVEADAAHGEPNRLDIRISYVVRSTNQPGNLVYPFYLRKPDETSP